MAGKKQHASKLGPPSPTQARSKPGSTLWEPPTGLVPNTNHPRMSVKAAVVQPLAKIGSASSPPGPIIWPPSELSRPNSILRTHESGPGILAAICSGVLAVVVGVSYLVGRTTRTRLPAEVRGGGYGTAVVAMASTSGAALAKVGNPTP